MKISIASDHAGFDLKLSIIRTLQGNHQIVDCGCDNNVSVDYPDFAQKVAEKIINHEVDFGILICGSGIGMSIAANRFKQVRASLCYNQKTVKLSRQHNDANILCLGARITKTTNVLKMIEIFLNTNFEGNRHQKRVNKLSQ
jgi:ribose 5-phosphate isomerase B